MSYVWESLFREEKQDWLAGVAGGLTNLVNLMVELPCTVLALLSAALVFVWEFVCVQVIQFVIYYLSYYSMTKSR
jgi:hypothetical protein